MGFLTKPFLKGKNSYPLGVNSSPCRTRGSKVDVSFFTTQTPPAMVNDPRDAPGDWMGSWDWGGCLGWSLWNWNDWPFPSVESPKKKHAHQSGTRGIWFDDWNACCTIASNLVKPTQHLDKSSHWIRIMWKIETDMNLKWQFQTVSEN